MRSEPESKIYGHVIALITARSGSKRVPEKNIRPIGGSSLLEIAITAAEAASGIHETAISTDSQAYLSLARDAGVDDGMRSLLSRVGEDWATLAPRVAETGLFGAPQISP